MSAVSRVRSLSATRLPEDLRRVRAVPARRRAPPLSGYLPGWRAVCLAIPGTGPACPPASVQRLCRVCPPIRPAAPIGRPTVSDNRRRLRRRIGGNGLAPGPVGCGPLGGGRGAVAAGRGSWHLCLISRDASRVQWIGWAALSRLPKRDAIEERSDARLRVLKPGRLRSAPGIELVSAVSAAV